MAPILLLLCFVSVCHGDIVLQGIQLFKMQAACVSPQALKFSLCTHVHPCSPTPSSIMSHKILYTFPLLLIATHPPRDCTKVLNFIEFRYLNRSLLSPTARQHTTQQYLEWPLRAAPPRIHYESLTHRLFRPTQIPASTTAITLDPTHARFYETRQKLGAFHASESDCCRILYQRPRKFRISAI